MSTTDFILWPILHCTRRDNSRCTYQLPLGNCIPFAVKYYELQAKRIALIAADKRKWPAFIMYLSISGAVVSKRLEGCLQFFCH